MFRSVEISGVLTLRHPRCNEGERKNFTLEQDVNTQKGIRSIALLLP
jgi:hypothetical protein